MNPRRERLRMEGIDAASGEHMVLQQARINVFEGEVLGLCGLNFSGKSALMRVLTGQLPLLAGKIWFGEERFFPKDPAFAQRSGIYVIQEQSSLIDTFTIAENLFLQAARPGKIMLPAEEHRRSERILQKVGLAINPQQQAINLSSRKRFLVEICRAMLHRAQLLVVDDVIGSFLGSLGEEYIAMVLQMLCEQGCSVILVEPSLGSLQPLCDRIFVMRKGQTMGEFHRESGNSDQIISVMLGEPYQEGIEEAATFASPISADSAADTSLLELLCIESDRVLNGLNVSVGRAEIVGIFNIHKNSGRAIFELLSGERQPQSGCIRWQGERVRIAHSAASSALGIRLVGDQNALFPDFSIGDNLVLSAFQFGGRSLGRLNRAELQYLETELLRTVFGEHTHPSLLRETLGLSKESGVMSELPRTALTQRLIAWGNALATNPKLIVVLHPTQRLDFRARQAIEHQIRRLPSISKSALLISADLDELLSTCNRILLVNQGRTLDEFQVRPDLRDSIIRKVAQRLKEQ